MARGWRRREHHAHALYHAGGRPPYQEPRIVATRHVSTRHPPPHQASRDCTMASTDPLDCALDLMRRLPPNKAEENLANLIDLAPSLTEDLLSAVDQPSKLARCRGSGKDYLLCDYNRDGDSYRSPWTNEYDPPLSDGTQPSKNCISKEAYQSVYMWDLEEGFACVVLIKKVNDDGQKVRGSWDSIHVVEVQEKGRSAHYKLTATVMLQMANAKPGLGGLNLSGSLTRQAESDAPVDVFDTHVGNIGRIVEDMERRMRDAISEIYFGKTRDIVNDLRSVGTLADAKRQRDMQAEIAEKLQTRAG
ncbi:hypothetical protein SeMB42_g06492 [Synchytrium endobioticum]|uniref:F-actin-capping protein subunit beta n=1 Tax=Synchytrium endobioticum TaxID=286115 RepID=A0A507CLJ5_9FUNG|nr:hypothetical protein SeMB42_g06492 [Synchytrium endobioticum]